MKALRLLPLVFGLALVQPLLAAGFPRVVGDGFGGTLRLEQAPQRIVSLAPNVTEIVFALGAGERLVGRTRFCDYPPAAREVPLAGSIREPDLEHLLALEPDLIIASAISPPASLEELRSLEFPVILLDNPGLDGVLADITEAGKALGAEARAGVLTGEIAAARERARATVGSLVREERPLVLLSLGPLSRYSPGAGTYAHDVILEAGGRNLAASAPSLWPRLDMEAILSADPEVILVTVQPEEGLDRRALLERYRAHPVWAGLKAVRSGRVHPVDADTLNRPGPRIAEALPALLGLLHPARAEAARPGH
jgi:iron complex transport system substrate-binding protein